MIVFPLQDDAQPVTTFLQSSFWARFKGFFSWEPYSFSLQLDGSSPAIRLSVLVRKLPGGYSFAYIPHGPDIDLPADEQGAFLVDLGRALRKQLPKRCVFLRFDPRWHYVECQDPNDDVAQDEAPGAPSEASGNVAEEPRISRPAFECPLRKGADVQPPDSVILDLNLPEEGILAAMKPKWRYNIRLAEKKGVEVCPGDGSALDVFYSLAETTAARDGIALHSKEYFRTLFEVASSSSSEDKPELRLWLARHDGQDIASIITLYYRKQAVYLYGAASDEKRSLMPAYALQWAAIRAAKAFGCTSYDMYGIPPCEDPAHPMAGLYRFKTGFGGHIVHYAGSWDFVYLPVLYGIMHTAENLRLWWHKGVKKRLLQR